MRLKVKLKIISFFVLTMVTQYLPLLSKEILTPDAQHLHALSSLVFHLQSFSEELTEIEKMQFTDAEVAYLWDKAACSLTSVSNSSELDNFNIAFNLYQQALGFKKEGFPAEAQHAATL